MEEGENDFEHWFDDTSLEDYEESCDSDHDRNEWVELFSDNPIEFFSSENLDKLNDVPKGKRMLWFSMSLRDLRITPEIASKYFEQFPNDLATFGEVISHNDLPCDTREFNLWSICSGLIREQGLSYLDNKRSSNRQYLDIYERRRLAPDYLLSNYSHGIFDQIGAFGKASDGFFATFDESNSNPLGLDNFVKTDSMFAGEDYKKLDNQKKIQLLQLCLSALQYSLVFDETNNSAFTKDSVKRFYKGIGGHNVSHSMLFQTYQPSSAYNLAQSHFDYEMGSTAAIGGSVEEYPFHRMILETLKEISRVKDDTPETVKLLVDFWDKNRNPIFANKVTESIMAQNVNIGANELLKRIRGNTNNKNALTAILYRLEFGRLGISSDGVKYLEKVYDLGESNNANYFVSRLTAQGDIGIFGGDHELLKFFNLGDLSTDERVVKTAVYDFVYETLFIASPNETPQVRQERERYLMEFKNSYFKFGSEPIFNQGEVRLNNLSFKEQGWLFVLWQKADEKNKIKLTEFVKDFGEDGIKLFLLLNKYGEGFEGVLFNLVEKFGLDEARNIFGRISNILNHINGLDEWLLSASSDKPESDGIGDHHYLERMAIWEKFNKISKSGIVQRIQDKMLARVRALLDGDNAKDIIKNLSNISAEAVLAQSMVLSGREEDGFSINDFPDMALYVGENNTLSKDQVLRIKEIYKANYKDRPRMLESLLSGLDESLKKENTEVYTMYFKGRLVGVVVFEYDGDQVYFGKFNIDPKFQGGKIGEQIMEETLDRIAQNHIVSATCSKGAPITPKYIERGFVAEGEFQFEEDSCLNIIRNDSRNNMFISKSLDEDFILDHAEYNSWADFEDGRCKVLLTSANNADRLMFPELSRDDGKTKWVITRFFRIASASPGDMACYVMENVDKNSFEQYKNTVNHPKIVVTDSAIIV